MGMNKSNNSNYHRMDILINSIGIDENSFINFVEWALTEQLVTVLVKEVKDKSFFSQEDALKQFKKILFTRTSRAWSEEDLYKLFDAVKSKMEKHYRETITYGDYLRILWTHPHICKKCGRMPPDVKLHIDHILPASLGGSSKFKNLQFLCMDCNLHKSNNLEDGKPWLNLM
jgi:hypothetical protein